ncbi:putative 6-phosphogluconate dehydrogenase [Phaeomoniella chlamydospora]|uniref:6-phosphogluconate dehydrogenase, decarboxylating n=1 Tax=Phaeomoniella chlamydospora TaxID=158046 RepID=A0A0G2FV87_PHACM|nr:putative 6-phosphogluconate dehydrogenase [Phaeomoniella chlamydospora]
MSDIKKVGMIGTGSMGSMLTLLMSENGVEISALDPNEKNLQMCMDDANKAGLGNKVKTFKEYEEFCESLPRPRIFVLSVPHGSVGDSIVDSLLPYVEKGDIVLDFSNEHYASTHRRQALLLPRGVKFVGSGVSGGYQSARAGPSISPGGDEDALDTLMPLLQKIAAKDKKGNPCVTKIGPGGSGHYVKMIHNGIEQGMMAALCEAWSVMHNALGMSYQDIAKTWEEWDAQGELSDNFLISIGIDICRTKDPEKKQFVLDEIKDKVVQDVDETEGTGAWTCEEGMRLHEPIPTIAAAHQSRLGSAYSSRREKVVSALGEPLANPTKVQGDDSFLEDVRLAVYAAFLSAFTQGLTLCAKASNEQGWGINFADVIDIWRAGCIIRSGAIADLIQKAYQDGGKDIMNYPVESPSILGEFKKCYVSLKKTVGKAVEADATIPSISATLEYLKNITTNEDLPTVFMEAELDYFGYHMFDLKWGDSGKPVTGD